ncbi:MAG: glucose 1-dehydrogenase [Anaerolineaceae bacterium]|nr:glucose 1-dehydrogenase [Anaerolineaceae bacterium]
MMKFTGKTVLITGGSRGIGRACAVQFAAQGARVAVHYHTNRGSGEETLRLMTGEGHLLVQADVAEAKAVQAMVAAVVEQFGRLDVLVNNAGIYEEHPVAEVNFDSWQASWRRILDTNLVGAANAAYCAAQHMIQQGGGHIVNVSSRGAFRGEPEAPAYGASKAGMNAMSQSLAKALAPHQISVTAVAPGWVETDMAVDYLNSPAGDAIRGQSPMGRVATPEEVAHTVAFLASAKSLFLTGAIVDVNGASYLRS